MQDCLRQSHALQHSLRELTKLRVPRVLRKSDTGERALDASRALLRRNAGEVRVVVQQFLRSEIVVEIRLLGKESDLRANPWILDRAAQHFHAAARRIHETHQQTNGGSFSSAIRTKITKNLAFVHRQRQRFE